MKERSKADLSTNIKQLRGEPDEVKAETEKLELEAKSRLDAAIDKLEREAWEKVEARKLAIKKLIFSNSGSKYISKWTIFSEEHRRNSRMISAASTNIDRDWGAPPLRSGE
jgi:hypothetical protein